MYRSTGFDDELAYAVLRAEHQEPLSRVWIYDRPPTQNDSCENALIWIDAERYTIWVSCDGVWKAWDDKSDVHHPVYPTFVPTLTADGTPAWCEESRVASQQDEVMERCAFDRYAVSGPMSPARQLLKLHVKNIMNKWHQECAADGKLLHLSSIVTNVTYAALYVVESYISADDESSSTLALQQPRLRHADYVRRDRGRSQGWDVTVTVHLHWKDSRSEELVEMEQHLAFYRPRTDDRATRQTVLFPRPDEELILEGIGSVFLMLATFLYYVIWR